MWCDKEGYTQGAGMWSAKVAIHKVMVCGVRRWYTQGAGMWCIKECSAQGARTWSAKVAIHKVMVGGVIRRAMHKVLVCGVLRGLYTRCWHVEC